ncbi:MAG: type II toxin-antitoxin system VapB family antitoxin [Bauldia litoralis]
MGINIKNPETQRLIRELADMTGAGQTEAITAAVREKLERLRRKGLADRLMAISQETAPLFKPPYDTIDHGDLLYDDKGLPK